MRGPPIKEGIVEVEEEVRTGRYACFPGSFYYEVG